AEINGSTLVLTYNEALDGLSDPSGTAFTVNVNGSPVTVSSANANGSTVTLTLSSAVQPSDTVTVNYTVPGTNPIQDTAGNDAGSFSGRSVTNNSTDTQAPVLQTAEINGSTLVLTYNEALDGLSDPSGTAFTVNVNGSPVTVSSANANGSTVTLTLSSAVVSSDTVTVSYAPPGTSPIQDTAGNDAGSFSGRSVDNFTANISPVFTSAANPSVIENSTTVTTVVATDADGDTLSYFIAGGVDAALFSIDENTGELSFATAPDFEIPGDNGGDNVYNVSVTVSDGNEGGSVTQDLSISVVDASNGVTDFDNDNRPDIVWRRASTGQTNIWFTDGQKKLGGGPAGDTVSNPDWTTVGVGDFDKDGKRDDIIWRNTADGRNTVWFMDGINKVGSMALDPVTNTDWQIQGVGDFDHRDYTDDIVWRNQSTGKTIVWTMDGTTKTGTVDFGTVSTDWRVQGVGDFEANNFVDDLVWRNYATGQNVIWTTDGQQKTGSFTLDNAPLNWEIEGVGDLDGDGTVDDLLWYNESTYKAVSWFIDNGTRVNSSVVEASTAGWDAVI
ncbi:MAG: SwmB domain-containing protein, partial [Thainema sp.]